ncbi:MAG: hypothetical protein ABIO44_01375 [Saprospiraceae bacterium]
MDVTDNFGLAKHDELEYQNHDKGMCIKIGHYGFPAWWRLQHQHDYLLIINDIRICATIKG